MSLLDRAHLVAGTNNTDYGDSIKYPDAYLAQVFADVESDIAGYLGWEPSLGLRSEEGLAHLVMSGPYAGRYFIELRNQPLVPGAASAIFSSLQLTYPIVYQNPAEVALDYVKVLHATGQVFCLAPGAVEALVGAIGFGYAPLMSPVSAVTYTAAYASGFATGISDPTKAGDVSYGAAPLPSRIREAALLLVRERTAYDAMLNQDPSNPMSVQRYRVRVGEREESYRSTYKAQAPAKLGYGGGLAEAAQAKLAKYAKRNLPIFA